MVLSENGEMNKIRLIDNINRMLKRQYDYYDNLHCSHFVLYLCFVGIGMKTAVCKTFPAPQYSSGEKNY